MGWEEAKDNRTDEQVKADYEYGKANERLLLEATGLQHFLVNGTDEFGTVGDYRIDSFVLLTDGWYPCEVKWMGCNPEKLKIPNVVQLKMNQAHGLGRIGGVYLQGFPNGYTVIHASEMMQRGFRVYPEQSYCNKDCYGMEIQKVIPYKNRVKFVFKKQ